MPFLVEPHGSRYPVPGKSVRRCLRSLKGVPYPCLRQSVDSGSYTAQPEGRPSVRGLSVTILVLTTVLCTCRDPRATGNNSRGEGRDSSSRWVLLHSSDSVTLLLDTVSIVRLDSARFRVWVRFRYGFNQPAESVTAGHTYRAVEERLVVDCPRRQWHRGNAVYFDTSKAVGFENADSVWFEASPISPAEFIVDSTCRRSRSYRLPIAR